MNGIDPAGWVDLGGGLRGYYARPDGEGPFPSVLIYVEAFGLNAHFERLTERFAGAGFAAVTPDLHDGATYDYGDLRAAIEHMKGMDDDGVLARTERALDFLAGRAEADGSAVAVTGFCMGGRLAFLANAALPSRFRAAAAFYGGGIGPVEAFFGRRSLLDRVGEMQAPIQLWYGAEDQFIRPEEHGRIAEALSRAGRQYTMTVFPRVTHGFFCEDRASYDADAARRSWRATTEFFREYLSA
jgi:carboxymethylenebutenolidase